MSDMIEKLKNNLKAFIRLSNQEQDMLKKIGKENLQWLNECGEWQECDLPNSTYCYQERYRIKPDYQPEPPKTEYEDAEIGIIHNYLCSNHSIPRDVLGIEYDGFEYAINEITAMPNFEGFYVNIKGNLLKLCLDDVAKHMNDKPFARFLKDGEY